MAKLSWILMLSAVLAVGCATQQPIYNVVNAPVAGPTGKTVSLVDVQRAILRAGAQLGWTITEVKPGLMTGRLGVRSHVAVIDIEYDTKSYNLKYKESTDLSENDGQIHRNYNSWIQNLNGAIRKQLSLI